MLRLIRRAEERVAEIYPSDKIKSPVHLSIGQESAAVGVCDVLGADDVVSGTYRGHATYLAKGGDLPAMFAELYGKATGCASGTCHVCTITSGSGRAPSARAIGEASSSGAKSHATSAQCLFRKVGRGRLMRARRNIAASSRAGQRGGSYRRWRASFRRCCPPQAAIASIIGHSVRP
jgi:hypothetical protein